MMMQQKEQQNYSQQNGKKLGHQKSNSMANAANLAQNMAVKQLQTKKNFPLS